MMKNNTLQNGSLLLFQCKFSCLFLIFIFCCLPNLEAQKMKKYPAQPMIDPADYRDMHTHIGIPKGAPEDYQRALKATATAEFQVTFGPGAEANPEAKAAFQFALDIWASEIVSTVPIKVSADFAALGAGVLASAGPAFLISDFTNAPLPAVLYPPALANSLAGEVLFPDEEFDLVVNLGDSISWYFETDGNTPAGLFDFVTIALHEIGHGLGFTTVREYNTTTGTASLLSNGNPAIYSIFMIDGDGNRLLDFEDNSVALADAFIGGDLFADGTFATAAYGGNLPELYAPKSFARGSSIAHWDEDTFPAGDPNSLMTPQVGSAESNFDIGAITRGYFKDMGWVINEKDTPPVVVTPDSFSEVLPIGEMVNREVMIFNSSENDIVVTLDKLPDTTFIVLPEATTITIPTAETVSLEVVFNTTGLTKGTYERMILVRAEGVEDPIEVPVSLRVLDGTEAPMVSINPEAYTETVQQFGVLSKPLLITNTGDADLSYSITITDDNAPGVKSFTTRVQNSLETIQIKGFESFQITNTTAHKNFSALLSPESKNWNRLTSDLYTTDFEIFELGNVLDQFGWFGRYESHWVISDVNAFDGKQHFRGISDGLGSTQPAAVLAFSPIVTPGDELYMVLYAKVQLQGSGVTWEIIPQSPTQESVVTRLRFNPEGDIEVLTTDGFVAIEATTPNGYFDLRIVVDKDNANFDIYIDNNLIFSGQGFATVMEQIVFLSNMEVAGPTFDIDNFEITDGDPNAFFLSISPTLGTVAFDTTTEATVKLDARSLDSGIYTAAINIASSDTTNPLIVVPVSLTVQAPPTIEVAPDSLSTAVDVIIDDPAIKTQTFTITNTGERILEYNTALGTTVFNTPNARKKLPIDITALAMRAYGVGPIANIQEKIFSTVDQAAIIQNTLLEQATTFTDSIYYDSGILFPENFSGLQTAPYTSAVKFDTENDFTLTAIRNGFRTETLVDPIILLEIYKGGTTPTDGELLLTQAIDHASEEGTLRVEELDTALSFVAGESFWVVHKYPENIEFPQGVDDDVAQRPDTYFFSTDGGTTYTPSGFVFLVRALSGQPSINNYLTLEPSSGTVTPGTSTEVTVTFDGTLLENGNYQIPILVNSNDPQTPVETVGTDFSVSGQTSSIAVTDELLLFDNVFLGARAEKTFDITNIGLSQLVVSNSTIDHPDFAISESSFTIAPGATETVTVSFTPSAQGNINGIITIESNASNAGKVSIIVNGVGVAPPIAVLTPDRVTATTLSNTTTLAAVTLRNDGTAPLAYSFPDLAVAKALNNPKVKRNNTEIIAFKDFNTKARKGSKDTRVGTPLFSSVGTDLSYGYSWIDSDEDGGPVYVFEDIATFGTPISEATGGDGTIAVPLPFEFDFYGTIYDTLFINANGYVAFQIPTGTTYINSQIPVDEGNNNIIAALWTDLEPQNFNGELYVAHFEDHTIVQWSDVSLYLGNENETVTFQISINADGNVAIFYEDVATAPFVNQATVGIENAKAIDGAQVAFNTDYIKDGLALRFVKPSTPISSLITDVTPLSGVIAAGGSQELAVVLDATDLNEGVYYDQFKVASNAPDKSTSTSLFELNVIGQPQIELSTPVLEFDPLFIGLSSEASFSVKNIGTKTLVVIKAFQSSDGTDYSFDVVTPIILEPGRSEEIFVTFAPTKTGRIRDELVLISDDAFGQERTSVLLDGVGIAPPIITVSPDAIDLTLNKGDAVTEMVTIANTGGTDLIYTLVPPLWGTAQNVRQQQSKGYERFSFDKIRSKEAIDTRVGPPFLNASRGSGTFGYTWADSNAGGPGYDYIDISATGTPVVVDPDGHETIEIPFSFNFYGQPYNMVTIGANGFLTFAPVVGNNYINLQIPDATNPDLFIAPLWSDIEPQNGTGIFYQATEEYVIVQYENVPGYGFSAPAPDPVNFQVILYKDGTFKMQYKNVNSTLSTTSTVGIEGPMGTSGLQVVFNSEFLTDELAITFTPPVTGSVAPGETVTVPITIATARLESDQTYTSSVMVYCNDPVTPKIIIPVALEVLNVPEIVGFTLVNADTEQEIGVLNNGDVIDLENYENNTFNITANKGAKAIGSVVFDFNKTKGYRTENGAPYTLGGDYLGDFRPVVLPIGMNRITANPYSGANASGTLGIPLMINFEVIDSRLPAVVGFTLVNADTNQTIGSLNTGTVVDINALGTSNFNVIAETNENTTGSVVFDFNLVNSYRTERVAPYTLGGDIAGNYKAVQFPMGHNRLIATAYTPTPVRAGGHYDIYFDVVEGTPVSETVLVADFHPNPVKDLINFSIKNAESNALEISLDNLLGYPILHTSDFRITTNDQVTANMSAVANGTYILRVLNTTNGKVSKTLLVKE